MSLQCSICPVVVKTSKSLTYHTKKYHPEKCGFPCSQCDERFINKSGLERHENLAHGEGGILCVICKRILSSGQALKKHIEHVHPRDGRNDCKKCDFKASNPVELRSHEHNVHTLGQTYKCEECSFVTIKPDVLKTHVKKAHGCENQCPACGKNYTRQVMK